MFILLPWSYGFWFQNSLPLPEKRWSHHPWNVQMPSRGGTDWFNGHSGIQVKAALTDLGGIFLEDSVAPCRWGHSQNGTLLEQSLHGSSTGKCPSLEVPPAQQEAVTPLGPRGMWHRGAGRGNAPREASQAKQENWTINISCEFLPPAGLRRRHQRQSPAHGTYSNMSALLLAGASSKINCRQNAHLIYSRKTSII